MNFSRTSRKDPFRAPFSKPTRRKKPIPSPLAFKRADPSHSGCGSPVKELTRIVLRDKIHTNSRYFCPEALQNQNRRVTFAPKREFQLETRGTHYHRLAPACIRQGRLGNRQTRAGVQFVAQWHLGLARIVGSEFVALAPQNDQALSIHVDIANVPAFYTTHETLATGL